MKKRSFMRSLLPFLKENRKEQRLDKGKKFIGILLILVSVGALFTWEKWGKNRFLYDEVLILRQSVEKGTVITEGMLEKKNMDISDDDCIKAKELQTVIGREAAFFIHKDALLFREYFQPEGMTADEKRDRYVLGIPSDWLASLPESLSKGDRVYFYDGERFVTSALTSTVNLENRCVEVIVSRQQASELSALARDGEKLVIIYS
ncbi:hypothetical protein ACPW7J_06030 [Ihubacter sp. rT4E-8]|uniref:hypothetical protein n=1 Tax=Ihubacter sp. rT4E-8 TaxID=3242369 RepID=UPI003CF3EFBF